MTQLITEDTLLVFKPIIGKDLAQEEATQINMNLYGFAKALIKAKLEIDGDENALKRGKI